MSLEWQNVHIELQGYPFSDFRVQKRQSNRNLVFPILTVHITYNKGDFPRRTPISDLHAHFQIIPIRQFIYHLTDKFFVSCPVYPNPLIRNIGNYTLEDLHRQ
jgi:hypothetical protein